MASLQHSFDCRSGIFCLAVADSCNMVTGTRDGIIAVWDVNNRKKLRSFPTKHDLLLSLAVMKDGRQAVTGGLRHLKVWDLESGSPEREIDTMADDVNVLTAGPGDKLLSGHRYGGIFLWDIETGKRIGTLEAIEIGVFSRIMADPDEVTAMALTQDGQRLIAGSSKGFLRVWDLRNHKCLYAIHSHLMDVTGVIVLSNGQHGLSVSRDGTLNGWILEKDLATQKLFKGRPAVSAIALLPGGEEAVWGTEHGDLCFWDIKNKSIREQVRAHDGPVNCLALCKNDFLASASEDGMLKIWEI